MTNSNSINDRWTLNDALAAQARIGKLESDMPSDCEPIGKDEDADEKTIYKPIQEWCDDRGYPCFHDRSRGKNRKGFLDFVIALPNGVTAWVEAKRPRGGRMSPEQKEEILKLKFLKHRVYSIKTYKQFLAAMEECLQSGVEK